METEPIYSPLPHRIGAYLIDSLVVFGIFYVIATALGIPIPGLPVESDLEQEAGFVEELTIFFIYVLYNIIGESSRYQATPGKYLLKLQVVNRELQRLTTTEAMIRNFSKLFSGGVFYLGFLWIIIHRQRKGWHDMIAGTLVIRR